MAEDPKVTITIERSTLSDALTALAAVRNDKREPDWSRASFAAAHEELAEAIRQLSRPASGGVVDSSGPPTAAEADRD